MRTQAGRAPSRASVRPVRSLKVLAHGHGSAPAAATATKEKQEKEKGTYPFPWEKDVLTCG